MATARWSAIQTSGGKADETVGLGDLWVLDDEEGYPLHERRLAA